MCFRWFSKNNIDQSSICIKNPYLSNPGSLDISSYLLLLRCEIFGFFPLVPSKRDKNILVLLSLNIFLREVCLLFKNLAQKGYKLSKTNIFLSRFEEREEKKNQIFRTFMNWVEMFLHFFHRWEFFITFWTFVTF